MRRPCRPWLIPLSLITGAFLVLTVTVRAQEPRGYKLRVDVNLVTIATTVEDASGLPVTDLTRSDFEILEDGVPQELDVFEAQTHVPLVVGLMVDASLSTAKDLGFEKESASRFVGQLLEARDRLAVYEFSDAVRSLSKLSNDVNALQRAVAEISPEAGTALYDAIVRGARDLGRNEGRKVVILITDGDDTTSENDFHSALRAAQRSEILVYGVVIRPIRSEAGRNVRGEHALILLAQGTGGRVFLPDRVEELDSIFPLIQRELRTQYLLGYYPKPKSTENNFHRIEVRVKRPNLLVRYRAGYYTRSEADQGNE